MRIIAESKLTIETINEINDLYEECNKADGTKYCFDENSDFQRENEINTFLLYDKTKLLASLNVFAPTKKEAEIVVLTLPNERKRGYFKELKKNLLDELKKREIKSILYVCDDNTKIGKDVITYLSVKYEFSEYLMKFNRKNEIRIENDNNIKIEIAEEKDINRYIEINQNAFKENKEETTEIIKEFFSSRNRKLYGINYKNEIIGMIGNYEEKNRNYIYGFCIEPKYQKKGIGKFVLNEIVKINSGNEKEIVLEVQTDNKKALNVYKNVGFDILTEFKYYRENI